MKKMLCMLLCAMLLVCPALCQAAPMIEEWLTINGQYKVAIPQDLELDEFEKEDGAIIRTYEDFDSEVQFVIVAGPSDGSVDSVDMNPVSLHALVLENGAARIPLTQHLEKTLGGQGSLYRMSDEVDVYFFLIIEWDDATALLGCHGPLDREAELFTWIESLRKTYTFSL